MAGDDEEAFNHAWDKRERRAFEDELGPTFGLIGPWAWPGRESTVSQNERRRVSELLARDRADRARDDMREFAQLEVAEGKYVSLDDTVMEPTPEQITQAERDGAGFDKFTPRGKDGTVRTVTAYKRRDVPQAYKMMLAGVIDFEGLQACIWYRNLYEATGLSGNIPSTDYQREVFTSPAHSVMFGDFHMEAQQVYRFIRARIRSRHLALLDQMILEDIPVYRAVRAARAFHRRAKTAFGEGVDQLLSARDQLRES